MCGFAAMVSLNSGTADRAVVERMTEVLAHRGPDDSGRYFSGPVGLGFRRLSILDLSPLAHQPMSTPDGQVTLVFNGEIYNYTELRAELEARGCTFRSRGDTEVLLHAYCAWGAECLSKLNGMWAFLVYDQRLGKVFGSRDRFGIKPLYCFRQRDHILLASEIKAIKASGLYQGGENWSTVSGFLLEGRLDETSATFFAGISQIPPATAFEIDLDGRFRQWRYWSVQDVAPAHIDDPAAALADLFEDSVRLHMRSDVPVGVHLSGGLDSTSILCAAARSRQLPLLAFSFMSPDDDESAYIHDTIRQTGAELHRLETTPQDLWRSLRRVLWFNDEPVHSMSAVLGYALMGLTASRGIKVILNGQGADETLAGYPSYFKGYWHSLVSCGRLTEAWREIGRYVAVHGGSRGAIAGRQLRHLVQTRLGRFEPYRRLARTRLLSRRRDNAWFTRDFIDGTPVENPLDFGHDPNSALARSIMRDPLPIFLRVEDRNSMAHSVEARVPFLDHRLVSLAFSLAPNWRLRGPWNKYVLREAMRGRIPESVRMRPDKMGFPTPAKEWFADELYEPVMDLLNSRPARERGIYHIDRVIRDLERHRKGDLSIAARLTSVAQFEIWSQIQQSGWRPAGALARSGDDLPAGIVTPTGERDKG